jgi:hypothetical protein
MRRGNPLIYSAARRGGSDVAARGAGAAERPDAARRHTDGVRRERSCLKGFPLRVRAGASGVGLRCAAGGRYSSLPVGGRDRCLSGGRSAEWPSSCDWSVRGKGWQHRRPTAPGSPVSASDPRAHGRLKDGGCQDQNQHHPLLGGQRRAGRLRGRERFGGYAPM